MLRPPREKFKREATQSPQKADFTEGAMPVRGESDRVHFDLVLFIFIRLLAGLWAIEGLFQWIAILLPAEPSFYAQPLLRVRPSRTGVRSALAPLAPGTVAVQCPQLVPRFV